MFDEDIKKYPCYMLSRDRELLKADWITSTDSYNHYAFDLHHFVRKSIRKNSPEFYARVEHLQKLILVPKQINLDLETMGADGFKKKYGIEKDDLVFSRKKWRDGYYD